MIAIENLHVRFGGKAIFRDFSLSLAPGEKAVIAGRSGAGKSTLLNVLLGFARPDQGDIRIDGLAMGADTIADIRQRIAWLPQELGLGLETAGDLFDYPYTFKKNRGLRPEPGAAEAMRSRLGLGEDLLAKRLSDISGGQKQRLIAASLILMKRPVMLLDEPTSALDAHASQNLLSVLLEMKDTTLLAATHNPAWQQAFDRTVRLEDPQ